MTALAVMTGPGDDTAEVPTPRGRIHPAIKLVVGVVVGVAAAWLVVSTAGGLG